jgi:N-acetylglucosaminyldiphosphoundecaprenol N-acetyl-beta-D-mannosaminyltransferase
MSRQSVVILGVRVDAIGQADLIGQVLAWVKQGEHRTLTYVNAHCLNLAVEDSSYRELLNRTDLIYVDGIGAVWAGRMFGCRGLHKVTGRNWITELCSRGQQENLSVYLLGGRPGVAERAGKVLGQRYPQLVICGAADGFLSTKTEAQVLSEINAHHPKVLLVGMGARIQEHWVAKNRYKIPVEICWSVGALFDYIAGIEKPVPKWLERIGLEWAWRLKEDPKGKWRRYAIGIPSFVGRVMGQYLRQR